MSTRIFRKARYQKKVYIWEHKRHTAWVFTFIKSYLVREKKAKLCHKHLLKYQLCEKATQ